MIEIEVLVEGYYMVQTPERLWIMTRQELMAAIARRRHESCHRRSALAAGVGKGGRLVS
jgi:hypothetical protein